MYRLSLIISEIYTKYLPLAEKSEIRLDLDIPKGDIDIINPDELKDDLEQCLTSAIGRAPKGEIKVALRGTKLSVTDSGSTLSPSACALLSHGRFKVKSKVGFGTTVELDFSKNIKKDSKN